MVWAATPGPGRHRGFGARLLAHQDKALDRGAGGAWATRFSYPFRWFSDVLHATEHVRRAALLDGTPPDPRMAEAIEMIRAAPQPDGSWLQHRRHPGRVWFDVDVPAGEPSTWLTPYAARVLDRWDSLPRHVMRTEPASAPTA